MNANELLAYNQGYNAGLKAGIDLNIEPMLRQQQAEIEALKAAKIRAYNNGVEDGRKPDTNNKPVAWFYAYPDDIEEKFLCSNSELIETMKKKGYTLTPLYTHPVKEQDTDCQYCKQGCIRCDARKQLTDEEINKLWAESHEDGIAIQQGFTTQQHYFANLILRKASEK